MKHLYILPLLLALVACTQPAYVEEHHHRPIYRPAPVYVIPPHRPICHVENTWDHRTGRYIRIERCH